MLHRRGKQNGQPGMMRLAYWEALITLRSGGLRITLVVFSLLLFIAIAHGVLRTQSRQNDVRLADQENTIVEEIFLLFFDNSDRFGSATIFYKINQIYATIELKALIIIMSVFSGIYINFF